MEISTKITGGTLDATEFNQLPDELENLISSTGQTPSDGDLFQVSKGIADYSAHGDFYTDSGVADVYVLSAQGSKQAPTTYADGTRARFVIGNANTGASTINVATLGVKSIVDAQGNPLTGGELVAGDTVTLEYDSGSGNFIIAATTTISSGRTIQSVNTQDGAVATGTTTLPFDNSIPQNTEGDEYITQAITPRDAANRLVIEVVMSVANSAGGGHNTAALFKDSGADALAAMVADSGGSGNITPLVFRHEIVAGSTSAITFKVRAGNNSAGTTTFNGTAGAVIFGGVMASSITITEVKA